MANTLSVMTNVLRNVVSKQRIRYKEKGFNLDLAYICENIIAMGYPADNIESIYRNRLEDVYKFLEENHPNHYKIYNLCLERSYDVNKFHGRVSVYPFEDHNPPSIELIQMFCNDVDKWLKADSLNVAAVHCKAGKGRTGTMICCYLLFSGQQQTANDALDCYDEKRTKDRKGVTIPSQRRYVQYFAKLIRSGLNYQKQTLQIYEIRFSEASFLCSQGVVNCSISELQDTSSVAKVEPLDHFSMDFRKTSILNLKKSPLSICGDIKVELTHKTSRKKIFHFWFNTYFVFDCCIIEEDDDNAKLVYTLNKNEIDDAHKDKEHKYFSENFKVQLVFYSEVRSATKARCKSKDFILPQINSNRSKVNYIYDQKYPSVSPSLSKPVVECDQLDADKSRCDNMELVYTSDINNKSGKAECFSPMAFYDNVNNLTLEAKEQCKSSRHVNKFSVATSSINNQKTSIKTNSESPLTFENYQPSIKNSRDFNSSKNYCSFSHENHNSQNSSISSHSSYSAAGDKEGDWESAILSTHDFG